MSQIAWIVVSRKVDLLYGHMGRSEEVVSSVADYCRDQQILISYDDFKKACYSVSKKRDVMAPASVVMRHLHDDLVQVLK